jgi:CBS domain-containing protein
MTSHMAVVTKAAASMPRYMVLTRPPRKSLARRTGRQHCFRHLPVTSGGETVGVLTDRDSKLIFGRTSVVRMSGS